MVHFSTKVHLIIAINCFVLTFAKTVTNNHRLANPELPLQPLNNEIFNPLAVPSTTTQNPATSGQYDAVFSDTLDITTSFPKGPTWQGCIVLISLVGKGIKDTFRGPCWIGGAFSLNTDDVMMWGDPDVTPISFYSEDPGTLVVIKNHECTLKKYNFKKGKSIVTQNHMSEDKCTEIVDSIHAHMAEYDRTAPPTIIHGMAVDAKDGVTNEDFTSSNFQSVLDGQCQKTVVVKGRGVADSFTVSCTAIKDPQMVRFKGGMLIGNPLKDEFSFFSEEWGTSVVVRRGSCILRRYEEEFGFMKIALSSISKEECEEAKKRMAAKRSALADKVNDITDNIKQKFGSLFGGKLG